MTFNLSAKRETVYHFVQASKYFEQIGALWLSSFTRWGNSLREYSDLLRLLLVNFFLCPTQCFFCFTKVTLVGVIRIALMNFKLSLSFMDLHVPIGAPATPKK